MRTAGVNASAGAQPRIVRRRLSWDAVLATSRDHGLFWGVLLAAALLRLIGVAGYPPALWFADSLSYIRSVLPLSPDRVRPAGYSYFLALLEPFHSVLLVTTVQAVLGLAMGTAVYAVLRRYRLPAGAATLAAVPVLLSAYEIQMEHFILSDTLFALLVTTAVVLMLWQRVPSGPVCALTGLLLGFAIVVREQGVLLPIVFWLCLCAQLARHAHVRAVVMGAVAMGLTLALSLVYYAWSFGQASGSYQLTTSTGAFLYSRVSTFARCSVIRPPADERWLCIATPPRRRPDPTYYAWSATSPINVKPPGGWEFDSRVNRLATDFALRAIKAQPSAYIAAVAHSTIVNFEPQFKGTKAAYSEGHYAFPASPSQRLRTLARTNRELPNYRQAYAYNGRRDPSTRVVQPFASWMRIYQRFAIVPGPLLALIALAGLAGILRAWRRLGAAALLPWLTGAALIITPAATTDYGARYVIAAVPAFCIAGALGIKQVIDLAQNSPRRRMRLGRPSGS